MSIINLKITYNNAKRGNVMAVRTDLALEANNAIDIETHKGIKIYERKCEDINIVRMDVINSAGEKALGKPAGTYITMEVPQLMSDDDNYHRKISKALANELRDMIKAVYDEKNKTPGILVAGLGNMEATPDSLGPKAVSNLMITRHIAENEDDKFAIISAISPGVMAQTGMETSEIISGIINRTAPDVLIVIDSLAARKLSRLTATIQISNTGIEPGSGVGNNRKAINKDTMGIPVIAIGVPTVVDASTLVSDLNPEVEEKASESQFYKSMYVTSKDIDALIKKISYTLSEAVNICMSSVI